MNAVASSVSRNCFQDSSSMATVRSLLEGKKMVETALFDTGLLANFLHADILVTACIEKIPGGIQQALLCVVYLYHALNVVDRLVYVKPEYSRITILLNFH